MLNNGSAKSLLTPSSQHTDHSNATVSYLSSCSKVYLDAYDREIKNLEKIRAAEEEADQIMLAKAKQQEELEKEKFRTQKMQSNKIANIVSSQIQDRQKVEKILKEKEQAEYNAQISAMPPELVAVFPKITETPVEIRKSIEKNRQKELANELEKQMNNKIIQQKIERNSSIEEERKIVKEINEKEKKQDLESKKREEERRIKYSEELKKDVEAKEMKKIAEKRLTSIEYEGMKSLIQLSAKKGSTFETPDKINILNPTKEQDSPENEIIYKQNTLSPTNENPEFLDPEIQLIDQYFNDIKSDPQKQAETPENEQRPESNDSEKNPVSPPTVDPNCKTIEKKEEKLLKDEKNICEISPSADPKLAYLLEKKQKKTNELLNRIAELERRAATPGDKLRLSSLKDLKASLTREGFQFKSGNKKVKLTGEEVFRASVSSRGSMLSRGSCSSRQSARSSTAGLKQMQSTPVIAFKKKLPKRRSDSVKRPMTGGKEDNVLLAPADKTAKQAYDRYLSQLESQVFLK